MVTRSSYEAAAETHEEVNCAIKGLVLVNVKRRCKFLDRNGYLTVDRIQNMSSS